MVTQEIFRCPEQHEIFDIFRCGSTQLGMEPSSGSSCAAELRHSSQELQGPQSRLTLTEVFLRDHRKITDSCDKRGEMSRRNHIDFTLLRQSCDKHLWPKMKLLLLQLQVPYIAEISHANALKRDTWWSEFWKIWGYPICKYSSSDLANSWPLLPFADQNSAAFQRSWHNPPYWTSSKSVCHVRVWNEINTPSINQAINTTQ